VRDQRDHARHVLALDGIAQARIDGSAAGRILRTQGAKRRSEHDAHGDDNASGLSVHESLPVDAWPGVACASSGPNSLFTSASIEASTHSDAIAPSLGRVNGFVYRDVMERAGRVIPASRQ